MNFVLTPEQEDIRKMVREFAEKSVAPTAAERDEKELFPGIFLIRWASLVSLDYLTLKNMVEQAVIL